MSNEVTFDYAAWIARYPEFSAISEATATAYFNEAEIYWANPSCVVRKDATQLILLNMVTAHIAALNSQSQGDPDPGGAKDASSPVGRIGSATEGSVSAQFAYNSTNASQWFDQTRYGAEFWAATAQYRNARYVHGFLQPGGLGPQAGLYGRGGFGRGW